MINQYDKTIAFLKEQIEGIKDFLKREHDEEDDAFIFYEDKVNELKDRIKGLEETIALLEEMKKDAETTYNRIHDARRELEISMPAYKATPIIRILMGTNNE